MSENVADGLWCSLDSLGVLLPVQQTSIDGVPAKAADDSVVTQPKDGLICVQWYQPLYDKLIPSPDSTHHCVIMLYAIVSKTNKSLCGTRWIDPSDLQGVVDE